LAQQLTASSSPCIRHPNTCAGRTLRSRTLQIGVEETLLCWYTTVLRVYRYFSLEAVNALQDNPPEEEKKRLHKGRVASGRKSFTSQVVHLLKAQRPKLGTVSTHKSMAFIPAVTKCPEPEYAEGIVECPTSPSFRTAPTAGARCFSSTSVGVHHIIVLLRSCSLGLGVTCCECPCAYCHTGEVEPHYCYHLLEST
jgi:hypothetical protein